MKRTASFVLAAAVGCTAAPPAPPLASSNASDRDTTSSVPPRTVSAADGDPCAAERTTLGIETCITERRRQIEANIQAAVARSSGVLTARGVGDGAALVDASQKDWERYRESQCRLHEKLAEGGSIGRIAVAYCRHDLARSRLADLTLLEQSVVE